MTETPAERVAVDKAALDAFIAYADDARISLDGEFGGGTREEDEASAAEFKARTDALAVFPDEPAKLPLIGRDHVLIENLAKQINRTGLNGHDATKPSTYGMAGRGYGFQVHIHLDGGPTGRIARVSVTLDRIEEDPGNVR